jgi:hypothetical protein
MNDQSKARDGARLDGSPIAPLPGGPSAGFLVWGLESEGYVSEEYLLPGVADVCEPISMIDGLGQLTHPPTPPDVFVARSLDFKPKVLETAVPFVTRLIVYRPHDPARFSGNVLVECLHAGGGGHSITFRTIHPFGLRNGDVFVCVQHPSNFDEVKAHDPERYRAMQTPSKSHIWRMIAEAGRAARQGRLAGLTDYKVERQYLSGRSFTGVTTAAFANYHHQTAKLDNGANVFDGYIPMACGHEVRPLDVPVIRINTQSDFALFGLHTRTRDSDEPGKQTRLYEIAGAHHYFKYAPPVGTPPPVAAGRADGEQPGPPGTPEWLESYGPGTRPNDMLIRLMVTATFANLYSWTRGGPPPPRAPMYETTSDGKLVLDSTGAAHGGLRLPQLEVPAATFGAGEGKFYLHGYSTPFTPEELRARYGSREAYLAKFRAAVDRAVVDRWLLADDAGVMLSAAEAVRFD